MKTCIILNPSAGKREADTLRYVAAHLPNVTLWLTQEQGDGEKLARRAVVEEGANTVVAAGGDGTIGEVVNGLAGLYDRAQLGILPLGTGNDLARSLGIPLELDGACALLSKGCSRQIDVIRVRHQDRELRHFVNVAVNGFQKEIKGRIEDQFKHNWGPLGYVRAATEAIPEIVSHRISLTLAEAPLGPPPEIEGSILVVANGYRMAGGLPIVPGAQLDDGKLDLLILKPASTAELLLLAPLVLSGTHLESDWSFHRTTSQVTIEAEPPLPANIDDVTLEEHPLTYEVLPRALRVLCERT